MESEAQASSPSLSYVSCVANHTLGHVNQCLAVEELEFKWTLEEIFSATADKELWQKILRLNVVHEPCELIADFAGLHYSPMVNEISGTPIRGGVSTDQEMIFVEMNVLRAFRQMCAFPGSCLSPLNEELVREVTYLWSMLMIPGDYCADLKVFNKWFPALAQQYDQEGSKGYSHSSQEGNEWKNEKQRKPIKRKTSQQDEREDSDSQAEKQQSDAPTEEAEQKDEWRTDSEEEGAGSDSDPQ